MEQELKQTKGLVIYLELGIFIYISVSISEVEEEKGSFGESQVSVFIF